MKRNNEDVTPEKIMYASLAVLGAATLYWLLLSSRFCAPAVRYIVRRREGAYEIRDYPDLAVIETRRTDENDRAFRRLFRYLEGANSLRQKIPMTTPVMVEAGNDRMSFVMPETLAPPPEPNDPAVEVNARPARRFATVTYRGWPHRRNERQAVALLRRWLIDHDLPASADPVIAYYDPPWMPAPFRRNEVLIEIPA